MGNFNFKAPGKLTKRDVSVGIDGVIHVHLEYDEGTILDLKMEGENIQVNSPNRHLTMDGDEIIASTS